VKHHFPSFSPDPSDRTAPLSPGLVPIYRTTRTRPAGSAGRAQVRGANVALLTITAFLTRQPSTAAGRSTWNIGVGVRPQTEPEGS